MGNHLQDLFGSNKEGEETWGASWQMQAPSEDVGLQDAGPIRMPLCVFILVLVQRLGAEACVCTDHQEKSVCVGGALTMPWHL
jgi:hypothetical protein